MRLPRSLAVFAAACQGVLAEDNIKSVDLKTHSLHQPYLDSDMQSRWWDFGGDSVIRTDSYVRLTPDRSSREGWLWSKIPITATNFEIELEFSINGHGNLYGDGFAMWITKEKAHSGPVFGSADKFEGLGIFFDTYKNDRPGVTFPYVMAMMGDGKTEYDKNHDGKANEVAGCSARGIRNAHVPTKARLTYFQEQSLVLQLQYKDEDEWEDCFDIAKAKLPSAAYLGFTAETGELSDNHDIVSIRTKNIYDQSVRDKAKKESQDKYRKYKSAKQRASWGMFFLKIMMFAMVCGGGYVGFTMYRARQRSRF